MRKGEHPGQNDHLWSKPQKLPKISIKNVIFGLNTRLNVLTVRCRTYRYLRNELIHFKALNDSSLSFFMLKGQKLSFDFGQ